MDGKCPSILDNLAEKVLDRSTDFWYDKAKQKAILYKEAYHEF